MFQYSVYVWKSKSENYVEVDVANFKFVDIEIEPRYNLENDNIEESFFSLYFIDRYGDKIKVYFDNTSPTQNKIDLEYAKPWDKKPEVCLSARYADDEDKHPDEINYDDPSRYPSRKGGGVIDLVPSDYVAVQLLSTIKGILEQINDYIGKSF